jgi:hypothetical protein
MRFEVVERDFVSRTLTVLDQYHRYVLPNVPHGHQFEVTLLLNSLLGLIVLPVEHCVRTQKSKEPKLFNGDELAISGLGEEWPLSRLNIEKFRLKGKVIDPAGVTLRQLLLMFRHCMAHGRFKDGSRRTESPGVAVRYQPMPDHPLESLILEVKLVNKHREATEFVASMPVDDLREFAMRAARAFVRDFTLDHKSG